MRRKHLHAQQLPDRAGVRVQAERVAKVDGAAGELRDGRDALREEGADDLATLQEYELPGGKSLDPGRYLRRGQPRQGRGPAERFKPRKEVESIMRRTVGIAMNEA